MTNTKVKTTSKQVQKMAAYKAAKAKLEEMKLELFPKRVTTQQTKNKRKFAALASQELMQWKRVSDTCKKLLKDVSADEFKKQFCKDTLPKSAGKNAKTELERFDNSRYTELVKSTNTVKKMASDNRFKELNVKNALCKSTPIEYIKLIITGCTLREASFKARKARKLG